ncbi:hypothetical protein Rumeso_00991 [Rubellimicrobium mesophilum DSM 19309]|uniref:Uncharacterized protein n=1 Tax=Rubellimicrobium mesophilum DSM 19309 TaxID=442562 RepID=A0A017HSH0_9RHOB|nr:hypothetical protein Rumeso_00991 [Rubellimicrobium mesophilum DSM 19309]
MLNLSHNANLALAIGSANWILARFAAWDDDRKAWDFVNAVWAEMSEDYACTHYYPPDDEWRGPIRGSIVTAMTILFDALDERGNNPTMADRSTWMDNFAHHVITPIGPYEIWFEQIVRRFERTHSWEAEGWPKPDLFDDRFPQGRVLSPEALDPEIDYRPEAAPDALRRYVDRLRRDGNLFVLDADEVADSQGRRR